MPFRCGGGGEGPRARVALLTRPKVACLVAPGEFHCFAPRRITQLLSPWTGGPGASFSKCEGLLCDFSAAAESDVMNGVAGGGGGSLRACWRPVRPSSPAFASLCAPRSERARKELRME